MGGPVRVVIVGAAGRMGREALRALNASPEFEIVGAVVRSMAGANAREVAGPGAPDLVLEADLANVLTRGGVDVVVDLSHHSAFSGHATATFAAGAALVIGCTGLSNQDLDSIALLASESGLGAIYAPNFAIGAVLMMRFAEEAARWMPDVEIIEMHHDRKEDAPSGTALHTADLIAGSRVSAPTEKPKPLMKIEGARGGERSEVHIHSVRLPGLLAHQQVIFGAPGEVLTIRHDATDRSVYMGGLKLCVSRVGAVRGLLVGMDKVLFGIGG
jgi:4-hydroxy-tetrahydrodipicolinate reductase